LLPESLCWLLANGRLGDAKNIILKFSNKTLLSADSHFLKRISSWYNGSIVIIKIKFNIVVFIYFLKSVGDDELSEDTILHNIKLIIASKILMVRFLWCIISW